MSSVGIDPAAALARAPEVLVPGDGFTLPELHAMRLDGVLARVYGQAFRPVNTPETPGLRAAALAAELPPALANRAAIGRMAAAWVYGCAPPPPRIALLVSSRHRSTAAPPFSGCAVHEVALDPLDVLRLGGALVTGVLRTAMDVALYEPAADARPVLWRLSGTPTLNCPLGRIRLALAAAAHLPGKRAAESLVAGMIAAGR